LDLINEEYLRYESKITWLRDLPDVRFVRMFSTQLAYRKGLTDADRMQLEAGGQELIGYADLYDNAPLIQRRSMANDDYYCWRRVFVLDSGDLTAPNYARNCPMEAVDPLTVAPQQMGHQNERAKGIL
jgi:hypothetical protein